MAKIDEPMTVDFERILLNFVDDENLSRVGSQSSDVDCRLNSVRKEIFTLLSSTTEICKAATPDIPTILKELSPSHAPFTVELSEFVIPVVELATARGRNRS